MPLKLMAMISCQSYSVPTSISTTFRFYRVALGNSQWSKSTQDCAEDKIGQRHFFHGVCLWVVASKALALDDKRTQKT